MANKVYIATIKRNKYEGCIFTYGIIPLLLILKEYEEKEFYEECQIIVDAIENLNVHCPICQNDPFPLKFDISLYEDHRKRMREFGFKGNISIGNFPEYIELIKDEVTIRGYKETISIIDLYLPL